jgi:hypothetical protein
LNVSQKKRYRCAAVLSAAVPQKDTKKVKKVKETGTAFQYI